MRPVHDCGGGTACLKNRCSDNAKDKGGLLMTSRLRWLLVALISLFLLACSPKPPESDQVRKIVENYLQEKIPSMVSIQSLEITKVKKDSDICTIHFKGVFRPTGNPKGSVYKNTFIGQLAQDSEYLDQKLLSIVSEETIDAFMVLTYENGTWSLGKQYHFIFTPKPGKAD
jgi:hypothetical protein